MKWVAIRLRAEAIRDEGWRGPVCPCGGVDDAGNPLPPHGMSCWPERWGCKELNALKQADATVWQSSYQQAPTVAGGYFFAGIPLNFYEDVRWQEFNRYLICDPALSKKKKADFTAIVVIGLGADRNYYLLDVVRARLDPAARADEIFRLHRKWRPNAVGYEEYGLMSDVVTLRERQEKANHRFVITELGRAGEWHQLSKDDRIRTLIPVGTAGRLWLPNPETRGRDPQQVEWVKYFVNEEWAKYPACRYDDLVDAVSRIQDPDLHAIFPADQPFEMPVSNRRQGTSFMSL